MFSTNIIGCGKLGKTIGRLIIQYNAGRILGIVNSSLESAKVSAEYLGEGVPYKTIEELPKADLYFITTKDDLIEETANKLHAANILKPGATVLHCSGSLSSDVLSKVKESNCFIASIHPIKSFANPDKAILSFNGTYCAVEGDDPAILLLSSLFHKLGAITFPIKKENKSIYHAGGVIANNYLVTLHYQAMQCYIKAGVDKDVAKKIVSMLMKDAFDNLNNSSHTQALTGPIQRGDTNTISKHINSLKKDSALPVTKDIYLSMGRGTIPFTNHESSIKNKLMDILAEEPSHMAKAKL